AYHDVQCESCHGPGFTHASEPDIGAKPLARLAAEVSDTAGTASSTATHFSTVANPRLCAGCHLFSFTVTQAPVRNATGHLFRPIPCYDANGVPTDTILNCAFTTTARSFKPCAASGCHATENQAALVYSVSRGRLQSLVAQLWADLDGDHTVDAYPTDTGYLAKIKANTTDLNPTAAAVTAADGAEFNVRTFGEDANGVFLYDNGDKSRGAHNPFYAEALLRASINELTDLYSAQPWFPLVSPSVQRILDGPLGVSGSVPFPRSASRRSASR
ncbi:MAG: hypothetical protein HYS40_07165, partial [Gemmatimonadetes bacterium]|nr:hypothetical protein [Gemmatimonadota bacterium]